MLKRSETQKNIFTDRRDRGIAWFAITSLMRTIELEFLQSNPRIVLDNTEAVEALHGRLARLLAFLVESENQFNNDDHRMQDWEVRIKDAALRIEDDIESGVVAIYGGREQTRIPLIGRLLQSFQQVAGLHKSLPAQTLQKTLQNAIEGTGELMKFVKNKQAMKDIPSSSGSIKRRGTDSILQTTFKFQNIMVVGHDRELNRIKELLLQDSQKERRLVSIIGMGGIGKTTFAQRLYNDSTVASHFDIVAWTTVSTQHNMRRMLLELCSSIMPITKEINSKSNEELAELLRKCLMGRRYLIVLDDIWNTSAWDEIQRCFPNNNDGSRILLTSRHQEVASYTSSHNYSLNMRFLDPEESWTLFLLRIDYNFGFLVGNRQTIWRHMIVEYCKGLPLAVVIVAGIVQPALTNHEALWESEEIKRILYAKVPCDLEEGISKILSLSYNHLPNFLKACFLYLGVFVEDSVIPTKKVIRLWIAEGFVKAEDGRSLEEVGEDHLQDLVCRSLVLINNMSLDGKVKSCKLHGMVHQFCRKEAMKVGLLHVVNKHFGHFEPHSPGDTYRWLTFETIYPEFDVLKSRSHFCFYDDAHMTQGYQLSANHFKMLRVLDLSSVYFIKDIPDLVLLRYIALRQFKSLSTMTLSKDWNLQTIVLLESRPPTSAEANPLIIKIWELPKLRHLQVSAAFVLDTPLMVRECLQTVYWLRPFQCTEQVFLRIPNAKVLGIFVDSDKLEDPNCLDNLRRLHQLENLKIQSQQYPVLLPSVDAFPIHLKKLKLKGTLLPWNALTVVAMLPNLKVLKLKDGACQGQYWRLTEGACGFPQLKSLLIHGTDLRHWTVTCDDFLFLERLVLKQCYDLEDIPNSFGYITTLQCIELYHCYSPLVNCAKQIQTEQQDFGNNAFAVRDYYTRGTVEEEEQERRE